MFFKATTSLTKLVLVPSSSKRAHQPPICLPQTSLTLFVIPRHRSLPSVSYTGEGHVETWIAFEHDVVKKDSRHLDDQIGVHWQGSIFFLKDIRALDGIGNNIVPSTSWAVVLGECLAGNTYTLTGYGNLCLPFTSTTSKWQGPKNKA